MKVTCISSLSFRTEISKYFTVFDESGNHFFCFHKGMLLSYNDFSSNCSIEITSSLYRIMKDFKVL